MSSDVYEQLADALDRLPNGFPRTASRVEIAILRKIFTPEEAALACQLSGHREPLDVIAERLRLSMEEAGAKLASMAQSGLVLFAQKAGKPHFRLAPFIVGIYEAQLETMDHELAHLVEDYLANGGQPAS
jgi:electron transport complex protein RnfB